MESTEIVDMPVRPPYSKGESVEQLEERERGEFHAWMSKIIDKYGSRLNYFEMNLEGIEGEVLSLFLLFVFNFPTFFDFLSGFFFHFSVIAYESYFQYGDNYGG